MKVLSLVKHVPDSTATIKVKEDGSGIETAGVKMVMNPFCEYAVEAALKLREDNPGANAEITAMTLGGEKAVEVLRTSYAMGVDKVVHVCDPAFDNLDELAIAKVLAAAIKDQGYDVIFAGKNTIDLGGGQVAAALAEHLGIPHVGTVTSIDWGADFKSATLKRRIEGAEEVVEVQFPAVIALDKGYVEPRYPSLPGLMKAKKKPVETKDASALGLSADELAASQGTTRVEFSPPPPRPPGRTLDGEPAEQVKELVRILKEEEKVL